MNTRDTLFAIAKLHKAAPLKNPTMPRKYPKEACEYCKYYWPCPTFKFISECEIDNSVNFDEEDIPILWAFVIAGVDDIHAPQDNLNTWQWERAEEIKQQLTKIVDAEAAGIKPASNEMEDYDCVV